MAVHDHFIEAARLPDEPEKTAVRLPIRGAGRALDQQLQMAGAIALLAYIGTIEYPWEKTGAEKPLLFLFSDWSHDEIKEAARAFPTAVANAMRSMRPTGAQSHY